MAIELVPLCTIRIELGEPMILGPTPAGLRAVAEVREAVFEGDRLRGTVRSPSADWVVVAGDSTATPDVRMLVETHDGALVYVWYHGRADFTDGPGTHPLYTAPLFETGDPRYAWLNRVQAVAKGVLDGSTLAYEVCEVR